MGGPGGAAGAARRGGRTVNRLTAAALQRINHAFYERHAEAFSATRERPWAGWERVLEVVEAGTGSGRRSVLDLGCGNGRFAMFLERRWRRPFDYLGVDGSRGLLEIARSRYEGASSRRFEQLDLIDRGLPAAHEPFDLVVAFGLLHHLPGFENRRRLLAAAAPLVAPAGFLAVSFWQFGEEERFRSRVVPWVEYNRTAPAPIDPATVEDGDALLAWGEGGEAGESLPVRYCHWTRPEEADRLLDGLGLDALASFRADGDSGELNLYRVLGAAPADAGGPES